MRKNITTISLLTILFLAALGFAVLKKSSPNPVLVDQESIQTPENNAAKNEEPHPDSLPGLMAQEFKGSDLKLGEIISDNDSYTQYAITYSSQGLKISGVMNVPKGQSPFPVLISNHGYIDPKIYRTGQGIKREEDFFARHGYITLHSDYRNHATSDTDPENDTKPRSGYTEDVINAVEAVKSSDLPFLDKDRIGMFGHSMGGGITLNVMVVKPDLVKAYMLMAPINSDYKKNFDRWVAPDMSDIAKETIEKYGSYENNPELWESFSAKNYFSRITRPIMLHQGTADKDVPTDWSRDLNEKLKQANKDIQYFEYPGEGHELFGTAWEQQMQRSLEFFDKYVKGLE